MILNGTAGKAAFASSNNKNEVSEFRNFLRL
jgi:hypothetical protein